MLCLLMFAGIDFCNKLWGCVTILRLAAPVWFSPSLNARGGVGSSCFVAYRFGQASSLELSGALVLVVDVPDVTRK